MPASSRGDAPSNGPATGVSGRRFLIHACLGRGGFGEVYRATMVSTGGVRTEVAVKILRADIDPGSDSVKRLRDEGRLLGALSHPSILRVHDLVLLQGRVALVTEFVEGEDLDSCLSEDTPFPPRCLVTVVGDVASALDVAWNAPSPQGSAAAIAGGPMHLVHRDVKPANVRLGRHGEVKLLDFGIARATNLDREAQTANNAMLGSYLYMAPERFHEERVEPPSDVYAVGCILYEGLTKHRLFEGMTLKQIYGTMLLSRKFNSHVEERLRRLPDDTPPPVADLLRSLLEVDPANRPTAGQVARIAEDLAETLPGTTLKRWARAREWAPQAQTTGTLDGCEIDAESFDVSDPPSVGAPAAPQRDEVRREPDPAPPAPAREASVATSAEPPRRTAPSPRPSLEPGLLPGLLPLPSPDGGDGLDAPIPGLVSREMARFTPEEMAEAKADAERSLVHKPVPIAPAGPRPTPPPALARQVSPPPLIARDIAGTGLDPSPTPTPGPPPRAARPRPIRLPETTLVPPGPPVPPPAPAPKAAPTDEGVTTAFAEDWFAGYQPMEPRPVVGEIPDAPEPLAGVLEDEVITVRDRRAAARQRQLDGELRQRRTIYAVMAMAVVGLLAIVAIGYWVFGQIFSQLQADTDRGLAQTRVASVEAPVDAPAGTAAPDEVPVGLASPDPGLPDEGSPDEVAPDEVAPDEVAPDEVAPDEVVPDEGVPEEPPMPRPPPAPAKPSAAATTQAIDRGWARMDDRPADALAQFDKVLAKDRKNAEALYGRGYALLKLKRTQEAVTALCEAKRLGKGSIPREVGGILLSEQLSCP